MEVLRSKKLVYIFFFNNQTDGPDSFHFSLDYERFLNFRCDITLKPALPGRPLISPGSWTRCLSIGCGLRRLGTAVPAAAARLTSIMPSPSPDPGARAPPTPARATRIWKVQLTCSRDQKDCTNIIKRKNLLVSIGSGSTKNISLQHGIAHRYTS